MASNIVASFPNHPLTKSFTPFLSPFPEKVKAHQDEFKKQMLVCDAKKVEDAPTNKPEQVWDVLLEDGYLSLDLGKALNQALKKCSEDQK